MRSWTDVLIAVDTNVLVYAHRDGSQHHRAALSVLEHLAEGTVPWGIPVFCIGEFIRVSTHPRLFDPPSTLEESLATVGSLQKSPTLRILSPGSRYLELFAMMLREADARGNLAFDAMIAAVCVENGAREIVTLDRDFRRFPELSVLGFEPSSW